MQGSLVTTSFSSHTQFSSLSSRQRPTAPEAKRQEFGSHIGFKDSPHSEVSTVVSFFASLSAIGSAGPEHPNATTATTKKSLVNLANVIFPSTAKQRAGSYRILIAKVKNTFWFWLLVLVIPPASCHGVKTLGQECGYGKVLIHASSLKRLTPRCAAEHEFG